MRRIPILLALTLTTLTACDSEEFQGPRPGDDPRYGELEQAAVVCGDGPTVEGIDVSKWQGTINWASVKAAGKKFAIARVSHGLSEGVDPTFQAHWAAIKANGMIRGTYQFFLPDEDVVGQANLVVSNVGKLGEGDLPVVIDVEDPNPTITPAAYTALIHTWVDIVERGTGKRPMIYTGRYYWDPYVASNDFADYPLWHAQYTSSACPNINDRWSRWTIWQYSSTGSVSGISGNVDLDRFNGTLAQLTALAAPPNSPPRGNLDSAGFAKITGWAQDPDVPAQPIAVHVYLNGAAGAAGATKLETTADQNRDDLCGTLGSCNHGFSFTPPASFCDGKAHAVHAYGVDSAGGANAELAGSPKSYICHPPWGSLDSAGCAGISGWAQDKDEPERALTVRVYLNGAAGAAGATKIETTAGQRRDDLCNGIGSCDHAFSVTPPPSFYDGQPHEVHVYAVDSSGIVGDTEVGSGTFACAAPELPLDAASGVRRHVPDAAALAAWAWTQADQYRIQDAQLNGYAMGTDVPPTPQLAQVAGTPEIYLLDGTIARHVPSQAAFDAWRFQSSAVRTISADELGGYVDGPALLERPLLVRASAPEAYLIDAPPPLGAELVSGALPATMTTGEAKTVSFTLKNRGSLTWKPGEVWLAPVNPRNHDSALCDAASWQSCRRAVTVAAETAPGATGTFAVTLRAPATVGKAQECFNLVFRDAFWFSDEGELGPADSAICGNVGVYAPGTDPTATGIAVEANGCSSAGGGAAGWGTWVLLLGLWRMKLQLRRGGCRRAGACPRPVVSVGCGGRA